MLAVIELLNIFADVNTINASVILNVYIIAESYNDKLNLSSQLTNRKKYKGLSFAYGGINNLQHRDKKGNGFARTVTPGLS